MQREEAFPRKKIQKPFTKLLRLLDKGNHVSRQGAATALRRREERNPSTFLCFLLRDTDFSFTYILLSEISVRGNKPDPGGFACWCAKRYFVRRSKPTQQSARPVSSVKAETEPNHISSEQKFTRCKPGVAV